MCGSETRFHWLADSLAQLVWTVDATGRISYGNAAWRARTHSLRAPRSISKRSLPARSRLSGLYSPRAGIGLN
jgi:PAS domain-containing protein